MTTIESLDARPLPGRKTASVQQFRDLLRTLRRNGVVADRGGELELTHAGGGAFELASGHVSIDGILGVATAQDWQAAVGPSSDDRIDRLIARLDPAGQGVVETLVLEGTPGSDPEPPTLTQSPTGVMEIPLWRWKMEENSAVPIEIEDERLLVPEDDSGDSAPQVQGHIFGAELTWEDGDDVTFGTGTVADEQTGAPMEVESALTKRSDAAWAAGDNAGGMDTGSKSNDGTLHCFIIADESGSQVDALFSESTNPTMPSGYTRFRRVGSVVTDGSGDILEFIQIGSWFWISERQDFSGNPGTSFVDLALTVPVGIVVVPALYATIRRSSGSQDVRSFLRSKGTGVTRSLYGEQSNSDRSGAGRTVTVPTDTNATIQHRLQNSPDIYQLLTQGWMDGRGA